MYFSKLTVEKAPGSLLAHSVTTSTGRFQKGRLLSAQDCHILAGDGIDSIWAAQLSATDVPEDDVATRLGKAILANTPAGDMRAGTAHTGRCNLYAATDGVLAFDAPAVHALNSLTEAITLATLKPFARVQAGQLIATIKIIPFAVDEADVTSAENQAGLLKLKLHAFQPRTATLILTRVAGDKPSLLAKAEDVTRARLSHLSSVLTEVVVVQHDVVAVTQALTNATGDIVLVLGGSAIVDRSDIIPAAIVASSGHIVRLGMPVDPGNLLCLARHADGRAILGLPGCARSPKLNGFDWVLERLCAGMAVAADDITAMGVGGLLDEIPERGQLRVPQKSTLKNLTGMKVGALLMAAGRSSRMGRQNKLLLDDGRGPIVVQAAQNLLAANIARLIVVTGRDADTITESLKNIAHTFIYNSNFNDGLSTSLKSGLTLVPADWDAVLIALGDMPAIKTETINQIITAATDDAYDAVVPTYDGRAGHPVLWKRTVFPHLMLVQGDMGGKAQLAEIGTRVLRLPVSDDGILLDIDTPEAWAQFGRSDQGRA